MYITMLEKLLTVLQLITSFVFPYFQWLNVLSLVLLSFCIEVLLDKSVMVNFLSILY
jgi:hypothetical protein